MAPLGLVAERSAKKHCPYLCASLHLVCIPRCLVDADTNIQFEEVKLSLGPKTQAWSSSPSWLWMDVTMGLTLL